MISIRIDLNKASPLAAICLLIAPGMASSQQEPRALQRESQLQFKSNQPVTDTWITTKIKTQLLESREVSGRDINVDTKNGVVRLSGRVHSQSQHDKAVSLAKTTHGVLEVDATGLGVSSSEGR
jgi:hyperosmotically inducible protein